MTVVSLKDSFATTIAKLEEVRQNSKKLMYTDTCEIHGEVTHSKVHGCLICKQEKEALQKLKSKRRQWHFEVPKNYAHATINGFKANSESQLKIKKFVVSLLQDSFAKLKEAMNDKLTLTISGSVGVGKTHLAVAMCQHIYANSCQNVVYTLVSDMFNDIKATYKYKDDSETQKIINKYANADILVLDEAGLKPLTEHEKDLLYSVINARYSNKTKCFTMVITNLSQEQLNEWYQERVASRMQGLFVDVIADDFRTNQAESLKEKWGL